MKTIHQTLLVTTSVAALALLIRAGAASTPLAVSQSYQPAAAASNILHSAAVRRLPNLLLQRAPATAATFSGPVTNGQHAITTVLPGQSAASRGATGGAPFQSRGSLQARSTLQLQSASAPPSCVPPGSGLLGWWRAEYDASDSAGTNHGQFANGPAFTWGTVGAAFAFNGTDQALQIPYNPALVTPAFTFETWIAPFAQVDWQALIFGQAYSRALVVRPGTQGLTVAFVLSTDPYDWYEVASTTEIALGQWTHLAATWDQTTMNLYIDGVLDQQAVPGVVPWDSGCTFSLGGFNDACGYFGQYFPGSIDEVSLYDRALFPGEIQAIYQAGAAGKCATPAPCFPAPDSAVAWWAAEDDASDAFRAHGGALLNGATFAPGLTGQAFAFSNAASQSVEIPYSTNFLGGAFSIQAWVKPATQAGQAVVFGQSYGPQLLVRPGAALGLSAVFTVSSDPWTLYEVDSTADIPLGEWTHLVATCDTTSICLYINGALDQQAALESPPWDSGCGFHIGGIYEPSGDCAYVGQFYDGLIDEVTFYQSALSAEQVAALYHAGAAGQCNIPGAWLAQYFGSTYRTNLNAALNADPDLDGLTNLQEFQQGRNPTVSGTVPDTSGLINLRVFTPLK